MGFYIRKSFKAGPFRINLSKSGIGTSFGVKGFRFGTNAQGKDYVHAGRYGLYYRKQFSDTLESDISELLNRNDERKSSFFKNLLLLLISVFIALVIAVIVLIVLVLIVT